MEGDDATVKSDEPVVGPAQTPDESVAPPPSVPDGRPTPEPVPPEPVLPAFVYAVGQVEPRFPSLAVEKEFAQASGRGDNEGLTDRQALQAVISERQNRYLARQLCWGFSIEVSQTSRPWFASRQAWLVSLTTSTMFETAFSDPRGPYSATGTDSMMSKRTSAS